MLDIISKLMKSTDTERYNLVVFFTGVRSSKWKFSAFFKNNHYKQKPKNFFFNCYIIVIIDW